MKLKLIQISKWILNRPKRASTYWWLWTAFILWIAISVTADQASDTKTRSISILLVMFLFVGFPKSLIYSIKALRKNALMNAEKTRQLKAQGLGKRLIIFNTIYYSLFAIWVYSAINAGLLFRKAVNLQVLDGKELSPQESHIGDIYLFSSLALFVILISMKIFRKRIIGIK